MPYSRPPLLPWWLEQGFSSPAEMVWAEQQYFRSGTLPDYSRQPDPEAEERRLADSRRVAHERWFGWKLLTAPERVAVIRRVEAEAPDEPAASDPGADRHAARLRAHRQRHGPESAILKDVAQLRQSMHSLAIEQRDAASKGWLRRRRHSRLTQEISNVEDRVEALESKLGCGVRNCPECLSEESLELRFPESVLDDESRLSRVPVEDGHAGYSIPAEHEQAWDQLDTERRERARALAADFLQRHEPS